MLGREGIITSSLCSELSFETRSCKASPAFEQKAFWLPWGGGGGCQGTRLREGGENALGYDDRGPGTGVRSPELDSELQAEHLQVRGL